MQAEEKERLIKLCTVSQDVEAARILMKQCGRGSVRYPEIREVLTTVMQPMFDQVPEDQRRVKGLGLLLNSGTEAPWMTPMGMGFIKVWDVRQDGDGYKFGLGNEEPPVLGWFSIGAFPQEWPQ
jgi:hypothetical protein